MPAPERAPRRYIGFGAPAIRTAVQPAAVALWPMPATLAGPGQPRTLADCPDRPELVVVPAGRSLTGSNDGENTRSEGSVHQVRIRRPKDARDSRFGFRVARDFGRHEP
jgi:formylglycine-generating enzyme required for sulfatase activity